MTASPVATDPVRRRLLQVFARWLADPTGDVVAVEEVEGRWAVRMRQRAREATTVWFELGERSLRLEAYVLPPPPAEREEVYRQCLYRNGRAWRVHFAIDQHGAIVLRGRLPRPRVDEDELELMLGEVYELIEVAFPSLVAAAFGRAPRREKSP